MENKQEFDSFYLWVLLYKRRAFIIIFVLILTAGSVFLAFYLPVEYKSTVNVVPPKSSESMLDNALGGVSSTLRNFGLSKIGGSGDTYTFIVVLNSRSVIDSIIHKYRLYDVYEIEKEKMTDVRKEFWNNVDITYEEDGNYLISIWDTDKQRAANMANDYVDIANDVAIQLSRKEARDSRELMEKRLHRTDSILTHVGSRLEAFSSENMIISPMEQATAVSKAYAELKAQMIQFDVLYDVSKKIYGENASMTQMQKLQRDQMNQSIKKIETEPGFAGNFPLNESAEVGMEFLEMYTEYETYTQVKAFLMPMVEKARIDEQKSVKSVMVLDEAIPADKKDKPKRSFIVAGSFFGAIILAAILALMHASIVNFRKKLKESNIDD